MSNLEINSTGSIIINANNGASDIEITGKTQIHSDMFVHSGSQINFNISDGHDFSYYRLSRKVGGQFGIVQDPGNHHILDISTGSATFETPVELLHGIRGSFDVMGSINVKEVINLQQQNPLPKGNIGDLAVSSSNQLYFFNGEWKLIV